MAVDRSLPEIPYVALGTDGFPSLVDRQRPLAERLLDTARRVYTPPVLRIADRLSRRWARRALPADLRTEIEAVEAALGRPGAWLMNLNYEWGCTTASRADEDGTPFMLRTLDWSMPDLGRCLVAAQREGPSGPWVSLTWPGFVGAVQAMAPGRFAAAINQAPVPDRRFGLLADWVGARIDVWGSDGLPPTLLLRRVFDDCADFHAAKTRLADTPICLSAIVTIVGCRPGEVAVIERLADDAVVHDGRTAVTNHWLTPRLSGRCRSTLSHERLAAMDRHLRDGAAGFAWLQPPILNDLTRLAMETCPATGLLRAQGYEAHGAATALLTLGPEADEARQPKDAAAMGGGRPAALGD